MDNQILVISGKQGSGKSTLTKELLRRLTTHRTASAEFRFAGLIYEIHDFARKRLNDAGMIPTEDKKIKDGPLLQFLGTEWGRKSYGADVWVLATKMQVKLWPAILGDLAGRTVAIVSDCRFRNEFDAFPEALRIRLECAKSVRQVRADNWRENDTHQSEIDLDGFVEDGRFDMVFNTQHDSVEHIATLICAQLDKRVWIEKRPAVMK